MEKENKFISFIKRHKIVIISVFLILIIGAICISWARECYENGEAALTECRFLIEDRLLYNYEEKDVLANIKKFDAKIDEAEKYSFFLPKELKKELEAYKDFRDDYPSYEEIEGYLTDYIKLEDDLQLYIQSANNLVTLMDDIYLNECHFDLDQLETAYVDCMQKENTLEYDLCCIFGNYTDTIDIRHYYHDIFRTARDLITEIQVSGYDSYDKITIYDTVYYGEYTIAAYESLKNLALYLQNEVYPYTTGVSIEGETLEEIQKYCETNTLEVPLICDGFDWSLPRCIVREKIQPIIDEHNLQSFERRW